MGGINGEMRFPSSRTRAIEAQSVLFCFENFQGMLTICPNDQRELDEGKMLNSYYGNLLHSKAVSDPYETGRRGEKGKLAGKLYSPYTVDHLALGV